jgi:hypothetical protein
LPNKELVKCKAPKAVIELLIPWAYAKVENGMGIGVPEYIMPGPPKEKETAFWFLSSGFT